MVRPRVQASQVANQQRHHDDRNRNEPHRKPPPPFRPYSPLAHGDRPGPFPAYHAYDVHGPGLAFALGVRVCGRHLEHERVEGQGERDAERPHVSLVAVIRVARVQVPASDTRLVQRQLHSGRGGYERRTAGARARAR